MGLSITDMPIDVEVRRTTASWALEHWRGDFPEDTIDWYLDVYREAEAMTGVPVAMVAHLDDRLVGSGLLVADDGLEGAPEPGPWLAAVFVTIDARGIGVGGALVEALTKRGHDLGHDTIYLYTESGHGWYESLGWTRVRTARLADHDVEVMRHTVGD